MSWLNTSAWWLRTWWEQPDQFEWVTKFLRQRGLLHSAQVIMAVVTCSALAPLAVMVLPQRLTAGLVAISAIGAVFCGVMTWLWLTRWPTRRQSVATSIVGASCIVIWSLVQPISAVAALGCAAMAITGAYMAFFHSIRLVLANFAASVVVAVTTASRLASEANLATAATVFWLIWLLNVTIPLAIRGTTHAMGTFATRSDEDPLTGLLNRRAFIDGINSQLAYPHSSDTHVTVLMVDLDDFKRINDTHGHPTGDRVLRGVADLLRRYTPSTAAICRAGGEEFLVAYTSSVHNAAAVASQLCTAIERLSDSVTASIGTTTMELREFSGPPAAELIDRLISAADGAMYIAKRSGGNQAQHSLPHS